MTDVYVIRTAQEDYFALASGPHAGQIIRCTGHCVVMPSEGWQAVALVQPHGWGYSKWLRFDDWAALNLDRVTTWQSGDFWTYKNGRHRFRLRDLDHGGLRQWGEPIVKLSRWPVESLIVLASSRRDEATRFPRQPEPASYARLVSLLESQRDA